MKVSCLLFLMFFSLYAKSQGYAWASLTTMPQKNQGVAVATDNSGNLFVAETYTHTGIRPGINIIKYDSNHNEIWKQKIEGKYFSNNKFFDLACDALGNILLTSTMQDSIIISGNVYYNTGPNMFIAKFNPSGNFMWLKQSKGLATGTGGGGAKVATDSQNNIYVFGSFAGNNAFDTYTLTGGIYNFITKYNLTGQLLWAKQTKGGGASSWGLGLGIDKNDNIYIAGTFYTSIIFDNITVPASGGAYDEEIYLAKIDPGGNCLWLKTAGSNGPGNDALCGMDLDMNGNPYITGFFSSPTINFGTIVLNNGGGDDFYVAKYNSQGSPLWATCGCVSGNQMGLGICVDDQGTSYVSRNSVYFSKFDSTGVYIGSEFTPVGNTDMAKDNNGCIYLTGTIASTVNFGAYTLIGGSAGKMYVAKYCSSTVANIKEQETNSSFSVFPNPTTGKLVISCTNNSSKNACTLKIRNALGQIMYTEYIKDASGVFTKQIDLGTTPKGIYFIELQSNSNKSVVKKIVLQ